MTWTEEKVREALEEFGVENMGAGVEKFEILRKQAEASGEPDKILKRYDEVLRVLRAVAPAGGGV